MKKPKESNIKIIKELVLKLAHELVWDEILEELASDCPNFDSCSESAFENYEPQHNEGYD